MQLGSNIDLTHYAGGNYETQRTTYSVAGQTVAVQVAGDPDGNNGLYYLHSDHIGSASSMSDTAGQRVGDITRYTPFGETRTSSGNSAITDMGFTGHKHNDNIGLVYMNARFYVPSIGRFASADTIVPNAKDPQAYNRYSYVRNNPLIYNDPSGHCWKALEGIRNWNIETPWGTIGGETNCRNIEEAAKLVINPDVPTHQRILPATVLGGFTTATAYGIVGGGMLVKGVSPMAMQYAAPYLTRASATAVTTYHAVSTAAPATTAAVGGLAETAAECAMTGGGCTPLDYIVGAGTAGLAHRVSQPCSFTAETLVATENGLVPISEVEEGMLVLAYNEETGEVGYYEVSAVLWHDDPILLHLIINGELVITTPDHPFFVNHYGWVEAGDLWLGAPIRNAEGGQGIVDQMRFVAQRQTMYDLTVEQVHNFFVGKQSWLVHNCGDTEWEFNKKVDLDWRNKDVHINNVLDEAFSRTGVPRNEFEPTQWGYNVYGKSFPTEYRVVSGPNRGAEVSVDLGHVHHGPSVPHVGYQGPGKRGYGGTVRGHILLDNVPYNRPVR